MLLSLTLDSPRRKPIRYGSPRRLLPLFASQPKGSKQHLPVVRGFVFRLCPMSSIFFSIRSAGST